MKRMKARMGSHASCRVESLAEIKGMHTRYHKDFYETTDVDYKWITNENEWFYLKISVFLSLG
jgi:hypothetical protein